MARESKVGDYKQADTLKIQGTFISQKPKEDPIVSRETTIINAVQEESIQLKTTVPDRNGTSSIAQERNTPMNSRNKSLNSDIDNNDGFGTE